MLLLFAVIFTLWLAASAMAGEFTGPVIRVLDGDTIEVLHKKHPERIRLSGIDCPEKGQPFEEKAKHAMSALVLGKEVKVQIHGKGKDRHTLADVVLSDGTNVNKMLVAEGWCWWYPKYALQNRELKRIESEARVGKRGLWADPYPVPPWEWQKWRKRP
jgi:endonuclease YncB( thermonuclease family)